VEAPVIAARMTRYAAAVAGAAFLALGGAVLDSGCSSTNTVEPALVVVATTDLAYSKDYDVVDFRVTQESTAGVFGKALYDEAMSLALPTTFTIRPGSSSNQTARIVVTLLKGIDTIVTSTAQVVVPASGVEELQVFLGSDCENVNCSLEDTCAGGTCTSFVVPPSALKPYNPDDVANPDATAPGPNPDSGRSMDGSEAGADAVHPQDASEEEGSAPCSATSCAGCCDPTTGKCVPGDTTSQCGVGGAACATCPSGDTCSTAGKCVFACGSPGFACCPYDQCGSGQCCDHGTCIAPNAQCTKTGGSCTNGACAGGCGVPNAPCCTASSGLACTAPFTQCVGDACSQCGGPMQACCPGDVCQSGFACAPPPPGSDASAGRECVGCGNAGQFCCDPDSGVTGAPTSACGAGLTCNGMNQCL
jgi:hypothetical protein